MRTPPPTGGPCKLGARTVAIVWPRGWQVLVLGMTAAGGGCSEEGGTVLGARDAATDGADGARCGRRLMRSVVEHACLHAVYGPHEELTAREQPPFSDVDALHVAYNLSLSSTTTRGFVSFRAGREGDHVFLHSEGGALEVRDSTELKLTPFHRQDTRSSCTLLPYAEVFRLGADQAVSVALGPGISAIDLVIERVAEADAEAWEDDCGSGSGDSGADGSWHPDANASSGSDSDSDSDSGSDGREGDSDGGAGDVQGHNDGGGGHGPRDAGDDDARAPDASAVDPHEDAGSGDGATVDSGDHGGCSGRELGARCNQDTECCSGRCYARRCVALECRSEGPCTSDAECCLFCHLDDTPHCH